MMKLIRNGMAVWVLVALWSACSTEDRSINEAGNLVPKTADEDSSLPSIVINGAILHSEAFGNPNDPMIVVLHGGPGSDYRYLLNCNEFANQGFRVVFYDQRGAGLSQRFPYSFYTLQVAYDDLEAVINYYRTSPTQKVFFLGQSWGAMLATAYINVHPTAISGAILGEPGGFKWQDAKDYISRTQQFNFLSELLNDAVYMDQFLTGDKGDHAILDYKFGMLSMTDGAKDSPLGNEGPILHWRSGAVTSTAYLDLANREKPDWTTHLNQYETQVLFIYSEHNRAYGLEHAQKVSAAYPHVQLYEALGAGHDMFSFPTGWNNIYPTMLTYLNSLK